MRNIIRLMKGNSDLAKPLIISLGSSKKFASNFYLYLMKLEDSVFLSKEHFLIFKNHFKYQLKFINNPFMVQNKLKCLVYFQSKRKIFLKLDDTYVAIYYEEKKFLYCQFQKKTKINV